jgi:hypothetical protein
MRKTLCTVVIFVLLVGVMVGLVIALATVHVPGKAVLWLSASDIDNVNSTPFDHLLDVWIVINVVIPILSASLLFCCFGIFWILAAHLCSALRKDRR